jgi:hypothetical protein
MSAAEIEENITKPLSLGEKWPLIEEGYYTQNLHEQEG